MSPTPPRNLCEHCQSPIPARASSARFCCDGCEAVFGLLHAQELSRYYTLAGAEVTTVGARPVPKGHAWLELQLEGVEAGCPLELDVQGMHCAACVWLMNETWRRRFGSGAGMTVNPALGKVRLLKPPDENALEAWVAEVEAFGYQLGPPRKRTSSGVADLGLRLGLCAALTTNVMLFSVSFYLGLSPAEGDIFKLFTQLSFLLSAGVVAIGGWPFFRAAAQGLRQKTLHLDVPIALGIVLIFSASVFQLRSGRGDLAYLDTLNTFITLMLLGRWLQQRVLEKNRAFLLEDDGGADLVVRRLEGTFARTVPAASVRQGDALLLAPGELLPVDAVLESGEAWLSTDWMTGEPAAARYVAQAPLPAGSFNSGTAAVRVRARADFSQSPLVSLLRRERRTSTTTAHLQLMDRLARVWVGAVLTFAGLGYALWLPQGPSRALDIAVGLLVVTCPCALGIAVPLAYELVQARLRRAGFFARSSDLLDRLTRVRTVVFDKTGTLTLGRLEVELPPGLDAQACELAWNLAVRSAHPVSQAVAEACAKGKVHFDAQLHVEELPGKGLALVHEGKLWRLGREDWARGAAKGPTVPLGATTDWGRACVLSCDGALVARFPVHELLRHDAADEVRALREAGFPVVLASGDAPVRVAAMAAALGLPPDCAHGGLSPDDKATLVRGLDRGDTLYLGDGVNDVRAFEAALVAGTPAVDRPVLPGRADFFLMGEGLQPLREALAWAQRLRVVVRRVLVFGASYNLLAVIAGLCGQLTPLRAAVGMPLSSLTVILFAIFSLRGDRARTATAPAMQERPA